MRQCWSNVRAVYFVAGTQPSITDAIAAVADVLDRLKEFQERGHRSVSKLDASERIGAEEVDEVRVLDLILRPG